MIESEDIEAKGAEPLLKGAAGILVPGGFGDRGIEGKVRAVQYARENGIPFFGICLGMQWAGFAIRPRKRRAWHENLMTPGHIILCEMRRLSRSRIANPAH